MTGDDTHLDQAAAPPVVAVIVVHEPGPWFDVTLESFAAQDYPNLNTLFQNMIDCNALGVEIAQKARSDPLLRDSIVYLTCLHELGHALGLAHTDAFADIMYFFGFGGDIVNYFGRYRAQIRVRSDIASVPGMSPADVARLRALYAPR